MMPSHGPNHNPEMDPSTADPVIADGEALAGEVMGDLSGKIDAHLANGKSVISTIKQALKKQINRTDRFSNGTAGEIAANLGQTVAALKEQGDATQVAIGTAAVSGGKPPLAPAVPKPVPAKQFLAPPVQPLGAPAGGTAPGGVTEQKYHLWVWCDAPGGPDPQWREIQPNGLILGVPTTPPYTDTAIVVSLNPSIENIATSLYNIAAQWIAANCAIDQPPPPAPPPVPPPSGSGGGVPVPVPPPVQPPPPVPAPVVLPPPACVPAPQPEFSCGDATIPDILTIGSPSFCAAKDDLRAAFAKIGDWAVGIVGTLDSDKIISDPDDEWAKTALDLFTSPQTVVAKAVWSLLVRWIKHDTRAALNQIAAVVRCWYDALKTTRTCNLTEVISLCVARGVIELLQRLRLGVNLALWGTLDVSVHIDPLVKILDYLIADACPAEIPSPGDTIEAYLQDRITLDLAKCWLSLRGCSWELWEHIVSARQEKITQEEFIQWSRRHDYDDQTISDHLRRWGYLLPAQRDAKVELSYELPTISDHLHWLQRNVFDTQYVQDYGLLDGFDTDAGIQQLPGFQGYTQQFPIAKGGFWPTFGHDLHALGMREIYAAYHYAAHWINPSPGQLAEMMIRLRPGRVDPSVQFTQVDYLRVLAEQDIAPYFRKRFLAIAFRTLPLRQLNAAAQQGRFDRNELIQRWQDIGFSATDASTMADTTLVQAARQSASLGHGYTPAVVSELAQEGLIDKATANARLAPQGFTPAQVDDLFEVSSLKFDLAQRKKYDLKSVNEYASLAVKAWEAGVVSRQNAHDALTRAGYSDASATLELDTANLRQRMLSIEGATKAIHKAFLYGEIAPTDAATALVLAGVIPPAEQTLVTRWQLEMTVARRFMSGSKIITWMKKGILSIANGQQRLLNLGYPVTEVMLAIAEAQQDIQRAQALAAQRNVKALAAAQKAAAAAISKTQKQFCKVYSPSRLKRWYALRIIDDSTLNNRLTNCGYTADERDAITKEAAVAREANDLKAAKKGATGIEYTGPGAVTGGQPT